MQDLIAFELAEGYEEFSGGNVSLVDGAIFDVGEALDAGNGRIVLGPEPRRDEDGDAVEAESVRAVRDAQIADALKQYPGLARVDAEHGEEPPSYADVDLSAPVEATVVELKERAKELGIKGFSTMNKQELAVAVEEAEKVAVGTQEDDAPEEDQD